MNKQGSFQQILEEKMTRGQQSASANSQTIPQEPHLFDTDPAHLAFLLGQVPVFRFERPRPTVRPSAPSPLKKRVRGKDHELTLDQHVSFGWFRFHGEMLEQDFTEGELKSAYRRLARKLHPDLNGGDGSSFLELSAEFRALQTLFP